MKPNRISAVALATLLMASSAYAGSFVGSSADSGVKGSEGSSDSIKVSSNSSADDNTAAIKDGTYEVARMDAAGDAAMQLTLTPHAADADTFQLTVPLQAFDGAPPQVGELVHAQQRGYGVRFARGEAQTPFYMALANATLPELQARALTP